MLQSSSSNMAKMTDQHAAYRFKITNAKDFQEQLQFNSTTFKDQQSPCIW